MVIMVITTNKVVTVTMVSMVFMFVMSILVFAVIINVKHDYVYEKPKNLRSNHDLEKDINQFQGDFKAVKN
jgi:hypothetical protein